MQVTIHFPWTILNVTNFYNSVYEVHIFFIVLNREKFRVNTSTQKDQGVSFLI